MLDVRLPDLSGLDLQQRMMKANREIPIVFITGHGDVPISVRAMKAGAVEFLLKPFLDRRSLGRSSPGPATRPVRTPISGGDEGFVRAV